MNTVNCPKCGGVNTSDSAFCGTCGSPLSVQQPASAPPPPPPPTPVPPPPVVYSPPPAGYPPPPPAGYAPPPGGYVPPPGYPPLGPPKILGDKTKWALGLGIVALFCCGPFTSIPGLILAKQDMDAIASGQAPQLNDGWAKGAFYLNIGALVLSVVGMCLFWGMRGMHNF